MNAVSVSELVGAIRALVEGVPEWQAVWVRGELSGVRRHTSGHWYFTLKDSGAQIRGVMFRRDAMSLAAPLKDGQAVLVFGRVGVYERDGQTQLYAALIQEIGTGDAHLALEALKRRLHSEGLFSRPKRPLPLLPHAVGVVTSGSGAARFDIETVVARRYPGMPIVLYPVLVQGPNAPAAIAEAIGRISGDGRVDVLIVGRGGGSREDLMAFNDERVVRAVFACPVPVISAVGHEIDTTLVDLVADCRAPTPSAAAELAVPEVERLRQWHRELGERAAGALRRRLERERDRLRGWLAHGYLARPDRFVREYRRDLERLEERMERAMERTVGERRAALEAVRGRIDALDHEAVLRRGYTYVTDARGEWVGVEGVRPRRRYLVHWYNGTRWVVPSTRSEGDPHNG